MNAATSYWLLKPETHKSGSRSAPHFRSLPQNEIGDVDRSSWQACTTACHQRAGQHSSTRDTGIECSLLLFRCHQSARGFSVAESADLGYSRRVSYLRLQEKKMIILVAEVDGRAVTAFNADTPDEVEAFLEAEPFTKDEGRSSHFRVAIIEESERWEASRSRPDHLGMSSEPHQWFAKL
jgi:hypothetical protein